MVRDMMQYKIKIDQLKQEKASLAVTYEVSSLSLSLSLPFPLSLASSSSYFFVLFCCSFFLLFFFLFFFSLEHWAWGLDQRCSVSLTWTRMKMHKCWGEK